MAVPTLRRRQQVTLIVPLAADTPPPPESLRIDRSTVTTFAPLGDDTQAPPTEAISPLVKATVEPARTVIPAPPHPDIVHPMKVTLLAVVTYAHEPDPELIVQFTNLMNFAFVAYTTFVGAVMTKPSKVRYDRDDIEIPLPEVSLSRTTPASPVLAPVTSAWKLMGSAAVPFLGLAKFSE
jgi:hypothetical protein